MRHIIIFAAISLLASCAIKMPQPMPFVYSEQSSDQVYEKINTLANQCWERKYSLLLDGVKIKSSEYGNRHFVISAYRDRPNPVKYYPFFSAEIIPMDKGTRINIQEGDFACSVTGSCYGYDYTTQVKNWVSGGSSCFK